MFSNLVMRQRDFFNTNQTKDINFRRIALQKLNVAIKKEEANIIDALKADLNKSEFESYMTEIGMVLEEISFTLDRLDRWAKKKYVKTPMAQFPAISYIMPEPYGVTLILSPWNYPFQLCLAPLVGAIAAGNTVILKPSELAPATSKVIANMIHACFEEHYIAVVEGGKEESEQLLSERFDFIFYTGGVAVGKIIMKEAAKFLTPVCLELGGKSPCIVDKSASLVIAAKRLVFGKIINAGQTCVAPDYIFVHESVREQLIAEIKKIIVTFLGADPTKNTNYPSIINERHYRRILELMEDEEVILGGKKDDSKRKIEPTILYPVSLDAPVMKEEIFGPVLPMLSFHEIEEVITYIKANEKPLALYVFSNDCNVEKQILEEVSFGGGCVNDTIIHVASPYLPFGGVGNSGMGGYHGKASFDLFSHKKSLIKKANWIDLPMRYHPYSEDKLNIIKKFLK